MVIGATLGDGLIERTVVIIHTRYQRLNGAHGERGPDESAKEAARQVPARDGRGTRRASWRSTCGGGDSVTTGRNRSARQRWVQVLLDEEMHAARTHIT